MGRLWRAPMGAHLAALGVILLLLLPVVGTSPAFTPDEGAAVIQATSLSEGRGWIVEHPVPEADPAGVHYPLALSEQGGKGFGPLAKKPLYPVLLAAADRVGGRAGMLGLSLLGTLLAAGLAAALARRIDPDLGRPTLWVVGLASPLLFDGYLLMAHTLAAAAAAGALLAAVVAVERRALLGTLAVAPWVAVAVMLRNEAVFFALALAAVAGAFGLWRRASTALAVSAVAAGAAGAAFVVDRSWKLAIVGPEFPGIPVPFRHGAGSHYLSDRIEGLGVTWLRPTQIGTGLVVLALLVMLGALVVGAVRARRADGSSGPVVVAAGLAAVAAVVALAADPTNVVPGLLVAFPLLAAGLAVVSGRTLATPAATLAGATFAVFSVAVIATQYRTGGTGEWGGRYFAVGLPALVPVVLLALRQRGRTLAPVARRAGAASLAVCSVALSTMAVASHRQANRDSARLASWVLDASAPAGERSVVVSTDVVLPRLAWPAFDDRRWLVSAPSQLRGLIGDLRSAGIDRFSLVTSDPAGIRPLLGGASVLGVDSRPAGQGLSVLLVSSRSSSIPAEVAP